MKKTFACLALLLLASLSVYAGSIQTTYNELQKYVTYTSLKIEDIKYELTSDPGHEGEYKLSAKISDLQGNIVAPEQKPFVNFRVFWRDGTYTQFGDGHGNEDYGSFDYVNSEIGFDQSGGYYYSYIQRRPTRGDIAQIDVIANNPHGPNVGINAQKFYYGVEPSQDLSVWSRKDYCISAVENNRAYSLRVNNRQFEIIYSTIIGWEDKSKPEEFVIAINKVAYNDELQKRIPLQENGFEAIVFANPRGVPPSDWPENAIYPSLNVDICVLPVEETKKKPQPEPRSCEQQCDSSYNQCIKRLPGEPEARPQESIVTIKQGAPVKVFDDMKITFKGDYGCPADDQQCADVAMLSIDYLQPDGTYARHSDLSIIAGDPSWILRDCHTKDTITIMSIEPNSWEHASEYGQVVSIKVKRSYVANAVPISDDAQVQCPPAGIDSCKIQYSSCLAQCKPPEPPKPILPLSECNNGCRSEDTDQCIPFGHRLLEGNTPAYCNIDGQIKKQKVDGELANDNHECLSNFQSDGVCVAVNEQLGLLQKLLKFFSLVF